MSIYQLCYNHQPFTPGRALSQGNTQAGCGAAGWHAQTSSEAGDGEEVGLQSMLVLLRRDPVTASDKRSRSWRNQSLRAFDHLRGFPLNRRQPARAEGAARPHLSPAAPPAPSGVRGPTRRAAPSPLPSHTAASCVPPADPRPFPGRRSGSWLGSARLGHRCLPCCRSGSPLRPSRARSHLSTAQLLSLLPAHISNLTRPFLC